MILAGLPFLVLLMSLANRFSGGGLGWRSSFRGRPIYYAGTLVTAILSTLCGLPGAIAGMSFILWRLPGWQHALDLGRVSDTKERDFLMMFARGFVAAPIFLWAAFQGEVWAGWLLIIFALWKALAYDLSERLIKGDRDFVRIAEYATGALWGLMLCLLL